ncbi:transposase, partial [Achromatium sp. WMS2]
MASNIDPRVDFAFKKLFGSEENKDLLISLINAILQLKDPVVAVTLKNPYNLKDYRDGKLSILDIKAQDQNGRWYNVEMQISEDLQFDKRALYYWCKLLTEQIQEGDPYKDLTKTFSINILAFDIFSKVTNFHNRYRILNMDTSKDDARHLEFEMHYVELTKFRKNFDELTTALDRWVIFLTRARELYKRKLPATLSADVSINRALAVMQRFFDDEER